jgi:pyruvate/2-oxoglutarate dehydrogenase complex dihydrolipoamide acyltransferase (E2) component
VIKAAPACGAAFLLFMLCVLTADAKEKQAQANAALVPMLKPAAAAAATTGPRQHRRWQRRRRPAKESTPRHGRYAAEVSTAQQVSGDAFAGRIVLVLAPRPQQWTGATKLQRAPPPAAVASVKMSVECTGRSTASMTVADMFAASTSPRFTAGGLCGGSRRGDGDGSVEPPPAAGRETRPRTARTCLLTDHRRRREASRCWLADVQSSAPPPPAAKRRPLFEAEGR